MDNDDLATAHLRRFSIPPLHVDNGKNTAVNGRDDSNDDDDSSLSFSQRRRRKKSHKNKKKNMMNGHGENEKQDDIKESPGEKPDNPVIAEEDNKPQGQGEGNISKNVTLVESPADENETPHRRLKVDNMYNGTRRRSSGGSTRRKNDPHKSSKLDKLHKRCKQPPQQVPALPSDQSNDNTLEEDSKKLTLDDTDTVYQADVSRTYESVSDYVTSDVALLDTKCSEALNRYKRPRRKCEENDVADLDYLDDDENSSRLRFVLKVHLFFRSFGIMTNGLVAGLAVAQCIFVFSYSANKIITNTNSTHSESVLLGNYSQVAVIFQSLYYFLLSISIVSILDRFMNIDSDWTQLLKYLIAKPLRAVALTSYLLSFIFSVSLAELDGIISIYTTGHTKTTLHQAKTWKVLNMFRVVTAIVGWVSVAFCPHDDITCRTIENMISQIKEEKQDKIMLDSNVVSSSLPSLKEARPI